MIKYWRVLILVVMVLASLLAVGMKAFPYGREGVEVVYVAKDSPVQGTLLQGMIVTALNGEPIKTADEWNAKSAHVIGNATVTANGQVLKIASNGSLGVTVIPIERTNLDFGLDVQGGTRVVLEPKENATQEIVQQVIGILETRANLFGLREISFQEARDLSGRYLIQVQAAGVGNDIVDELLSRQGRFEAKVVKPVQLLGGSGTIQLGTRSYPISLNGTSVIINNTRIPVNGTFQLEGIPFTYLNTTAGKALLQATLFDSEDIELVYNDPQRSGVVQQGSGYQFFFGILIATDGAQRFADVTTGITKYLDINSGEEFLDSSLQLFIDGKEVSSLRIGASLGGQVVQSPQVTGGAASLDEAVKEKLRLQTILQSGALPVSLSTLSVDVISPTLGLGFFDAVIKAELMAVAIVFLIVFVRYRKIRISVPMTLVTLSEVIIILGIASKADSGIWTITLIINMVIIAIAWVKKQEMDVYALIGAILLPLIGYMSWTIDLPAIAGIIAVIGTGIDHQIIITDEVLSGHRKVYGIREQLKSAFFIVMGAAGTVIAAMLPLMFIGVGLVRGFAITTIVGVLIGILVTRPAFAKIIEKVAGSIPEKAEKPASPAATS